MSGSLSGTYLSSYSDPNDPGVTVYTYPGSSDCTWQAQSSSLASVISVAPNAASGVPAGTTSPPQDAPTSFYSMAISTSTGTGFGTPGPYGTETIKAIFTDSPLFKVTGCYEYGQYTTDSNGQTVYTATVGPAMSCGTPFTGATNVKYGYSSSTEIGDIQFTYSPDASETSGTWDYGNIIIEVQNSTGYGFYYVPVSGYVQ